MSRLTDAEDKVRAFAAEMRDRADSLLHDVAPVVHDSAARLEDLAKSKIVTELMQYGEDVLGSPTVDAIVALIRSAGEAASKIAELSAPPVVTPPAPSAQQGGAGL